MKWTTRIILAILVMMFEITGFFDPADGIHSLCAAVEILILLMYGLFFLLKTAFH